MSIFDLVVVGSGGGVAETDLSGYLMKPCASSWEDGIIALEAGSGKGALNRLLRANPSLFDPDKTFTANDVYSQVACFLITHAHIDHIASLSICAGSFGGCRKKVFAASKVLEDLETLFGDRLWPNLASWDENDEDHKLLYSELPLKKYHTIFPGVSVQTWDISHGTNSSGDYDSAAFFIRDDATRHELLFFGDVEPDRIACHPRTIHVWRQAATKIPENLSTIFIECSWPSGRPDHLLYGHLTPEHLVDELTNLAQEVVNARNENQVRSPSPSSPIRRNGSSPSSSPPLKRQKREHRETAPETIEGALVGLTVYVTHCKDDLDGAERPPREIIVEQIRKLVKERGLGVEVLAAAQGMTIKI